MILKRVTEALEAYKNGEMLIVMDDEDRENEGDLVLAGIFSTPEKINFMVRMLGVDLRVFNQRFSEQI